MRREFNFPLFFPLPTLRPFFNVRFSWTSPCVVCVRPLFLFHFSLFWMCVLGMSPYTVTMTHITPVFVFASSFSNMFTFQKSLFSFVFSYFVSTSSSDLSLSHVPTSRPKAWNNPTRSRDSTSSSRTTNRISDGVPLNQ